MHHGQFRFKEYVRFWLHVWHIVVKLKYLMQTERERLEKMRCSWEDMQWAMSVLHSRCFLVGSPPVHTIVPGVDMANHSSEPSAAVRWVQAVQCLSRHI